jgi:hypothetical protein
MAIRRKHIRAFVEMLLERHHVTQGAVPVETIAESHGIEIKRDKVDSNYQVSCIETRQK